MIGWIFTTSTIYDTIKAYDNFFKCIPKKIYKIYNEGKKNIILFKHFWAA